jgi:hypothetical protein
VLAALLLAAGCAADGEGSESGGAEGSSTDGGGDGDEVFEPSDFTGVPPPERACADASSITITDSSGEEVVPIETTSYATVVGAEARIVVTDAEVLASDITSGAEPVLAEGQVWVELSLRTTGDTSPQPGLYEVSGGDDSVTELVDDVRVLFGSEVLPVEGPTEFGLDEIDPTTLCGTIYVEAGDGTVTVEGTVVADRLA